MEDDDSDTEMADDGTQAEHCQARSLLGVCRLHSPMHDISVRLSHWQVPTSATSKREADDSCMFPELPSLGP
jgi:hypothetical protein